jgi:ribosomal protein L11 methylase PrmA
VALPPRGLEPLLVDALRRGGAREVRRAEGRVVARFVSVGTPAAARIEALLRSALPGWTADPRWRPFDGAGWLAERGEEQVPLPGHAPLRILPGVAFGDGRHPTTRRCLGLLAERVRPGDRIADVGAGSGILAVAAARLGAREVLAVEMDPEGCRETRVNAGANGVRVRVVCHRVHPDAPGPLGDGTAGSWEGIVANLEAGVLVPLLPLLVRCLAPGGWLVVSGVLGSERKRVAGAAKALRLNHAHDDDGWWTLAFSRADPAPASG